MQTNFFVQSGLGWVLALVLGFPLAMLVLGEVILRLERRQWPMAGPMRILRSWVLPSLALFVFLVQVIQRPRTDIIVRISEMLLWMTLIYAALTLLNVILFEDAPEGSWQAKVPQLFRDLGRFVLVLVGAAIVLSTVWGADLGSLLTALGVGSLVIGLALQDSLGNIFSGVSLLFEQPFSLGDWIQVGDRLGEVVEINWRSVHIETSSGDLVIVPNSEIAQGSFTNFSQPRPIYEKVIDISFSYDDPPRKVIRLLKQTALKAPGVIPDSIWVSLSGYGDFAINYQIGLSAPTMPQAVRMRNEFMLRLWYVSKRHNLTMPYPVQVEAPYQTTLPTPEEEQVINLQALRSLAGLASLPVATLEKILQRSQLRDYAEQEVVIEVDTPLSGLYLLVEGQVELLAPNPRGQLRTLGVLSPGEFFGEKASLLSDQTSEVTVIAAEDLRLLLIPTDTLQLILEQSPRLGHDLGEVMEIRRRAVQSIREMA
jgi:small-conductance mechanosensitive channel